MDGHIKEVQLISTEKMKTVYTKLVADLFHFGHVEFLRNARALGDRLVVHVVDDERVKAAKRLPVMNQQERAAVVEACKYVDEVTLVGPKVITLDFMLKNQFHIYAVSFSSEKEKQTKLKHCGDLPSEMIGVLSYTEGISTTAIIDRVRSRSS